MVNKRNILVTGGTSGLGFELVKILAGKGFDVLATGRQLSGDRSRIPGLSFLKVDFSDLDDTAGKFREVCKERHFDAVVNNAGILSPPVYTPTIDGYEYTFQVNFLAQLLIDEIVLQSSSQLETTEIITVTSPVYRIAEPGWLNEDDRSKYRPLRAYSASKLALALMFEILPEGKPGRKLSGFVFNPGTFRSGIHRMQEKWFSTMYGIAAPFMRNPARVAAALADLMTDGVNRYGQIFDYRKRQMAYPRDAVAGAVVLAARSYSLLEKYLFLG